MDPDGKTALVSGASRGIGSAIARVLANCGADVIGVGRRIMQDESKSGKLYRLSDVELPDYGYFIVRPHRSTATETVRLLSDWLQCQT